MSIPIGPREYHHRMLVALDVDGSGDLSHAELKALFATKLDEATSERQASAYIAAQDGTVFRDPDGVLHLGELGFNELLSPYAMNAMLNEIEAAADAQGYRGFAHPGLMDVARARVFDELDKNDDQELSSSELALLARTDASAANTAAADFLQVADKDNSGGVNFEEAKLFGALCRRNLDYVAGKLATSPEGQAASLTEWMIRSADKDQNSALSTAEWATLQNLPDAESIFAKIDLNQDGKVDEEELTPWLRGWEMCGARIATASTEMLQSSLLKREDRDGDGSLGMEELTQVSGSNGAAAMLASFDENKDGALTAAELQHAMSQRNDRYYEMAGLIGRAKWTSDPQVWRVDFGSAAELALHRALWSGIERLVSNMPGAVTARPLKA